jgi:hypothetical protein
MPRAARHEHSTWSTALLGAIAFPPSSPPAVFVGPFVMVGVLVRVGVIEVIFGRAFQGVSGRSGGYLDTVQTAMSAPT